MKINYLCLLLASTVLAFCVYRVSAEVRDHADSPVKNENGCECIDYDCGCCERIVVDSFSMNGSLCANASYLARDYGISLTVTYNDIAIINETVSARNPPPICVGEDIIEALDIEVCVRIYDIDVNSGKFHACFELLGRLMKLKFGKIKLGCFNAGEPQILFDNRIVNNIKRFFHNETVPTVIRV